MTSTNNAAIFNVQEPTGLEQTKLETTAAAAQINAPNSAAARQVEHNAELAHEAAEDAAAAAKGFYGDSPKQVPHHAPGSAAQQLHNKTDAAVAQGQSDVQDAKAAGAGYISQATTMAGNALATAQTYLPESLGGQTQVAPAASSAAASLQSGATVVLGTAKDLAYQAHTVITPAVVSGAQQAAAVIQPAVVAGAQSVSSTVSSYLPGTGTTPATAEVSITGIPASSSVGNPPAPSTGIHAAGTTNFPASSTGIPATSAPLQAGGHSTTAVPGAAHVTGSSNTPGAPPSAFSGTGASDRQI